MNEPADRKSFLHRTASLLTSICALLIVFSFLKYKNAIYKLDHDYFKVPMHLKWSYDKKKVNQDILLTTVLKESPCFNESFQLYRSFLKPNCWSELTHKRKNRALLSEDVLCAFETVYPRPVMRKKKFTVLLISVHSGPFINEQKTLACADFEFIAWNPKTSVLFPNVSNLLHEVYSPEHLLKTQKAFWDSYKDHPDLKRADVIICGFDDWHCFIFAPFNKKIILNHVYRFEGHFSPTGPNTKIFQSVMYDAVRYNPDVILAGGNVYDVIYAQHFLGSHKIIPLLSDCEYVHESLKAELQSGKCPDVPFDTLGYHPNKDVIAIFPFRLSEGGNIVLKLVTEHLQKHSLSFRLFIGKNQRGYNYCDLGTYRAVIMLPYSVMSYFSCELASLGIPIFMPSPTLLAEWQKMYHILQERKSDLGHKDTDFLMQNTRSFNRGYHPNSDFQLESLKRWIGYADLYYQGAEVYNSLEELFLKIEKKNFQEINQRFLTHRVQSVVRNRLNWNSVYRYFYGSDLVVNHDVIIPNSFMDGMQLWERKVSRPAHFMHEYVTSKQLLDDQVDWIILEQDRSEYLPDCNLSPLYKVALFDFEATVKKNSSFGCHIVTLADIRSAHPDEFLFYLSESIFKKYPKWKEQTHLKLMLMMVYAIKKGASSVTLLTPRVASKKDCSLPYPLNSLVEDSSNWIVTRYSKNEYWYAWMPLNEQLSEIWRISMLKFIDLENKAKLAENKCIVSATNSVYFDEEEIRYFEEYLRYWETDEEFSFAHLLDQNMFELAVKGYVTKFYAEHYRDFLQNIARVGHHWYVSTENTKYK